MTGRSTYSSQEETRHCGSKIPGREHLKLSVGGQQIRFMQLGSRFSILTTMAGWTFRLPDAVSPTLRCLGIWEEEPPKLSRPFQKLGGFRPLASPLSTTTTTAG